MGLSQKQLDEDGVPISFQKKGEVSVRNGPCSAGELSAKKIPLDGRVYICGGEIILKNGRRLRAHFEIQTHTFDFLDRESVWVTLDADMWYTLDERELHKLLGLKRKDIFPYRWLPDRPLKYHVPGPYPMEWPEEGDDEEE